MDDRENVIKAKNKDKELLCIAKEIRGGIKSGAGYNLVRLTIEKGLAEYLADRVEELCRDNKAFLKGQEAQAVLSNHVCESDPCRYVRKGFCPKCHQEVEWLLNRSYCGFCGQAVKWD